LKLGWATPFNANSAIARFSADVTRELIALGHEVTILRSEVGEDLALPPLPSNAPIISANRKWNADKFDLVVINIGDNHAYHGGISLNAKLHAVGIFHDWCIVNLFNGWLAGTRDQFQGDEIVRRLYGAAVLRQFQEASPRDFLEIAGRLFPMTEWYAERLDGALVHSDFYLESVRSACPGPVMRLPLAYAGRTPMDQSPRRTDGLIHVLTFGMVNPNKRIESVLRALAARPELKERIAYRVAGSVTPQERTRLERIAAECGVTHFHLEGRVSDDLLDKLIRESDIICCLRFPALEGSSASVLEAMQSGRPVIVTDTGCYAEIPDGLVLKIRPQAEISDLQQHLFALLQSPDERERMGQAAALWARDQSDPARYARDAMAHFQRVITTQPLLRCAESAGREAGLWGLEPNDPFLRRVATQFENLWPKS